jgi:mRNA interferase MazF
MYNQASSSASRYQSKNNHFYQGGIYYGDLGKDVMGSEQRGIRPLVVLQNDIGNLHSNTVIVAPITKEYKFNNPAYRKKLLSTHVSIRSKDYEFLREDSKIITEQIRTIDKKRFLSNKQAGYINISDYISVQMATIISLGLIDIQYKSKGIQRGDIYLADLGKGVGHEFKGQVPVVVVQNEIGNEHSPTVIVVPINLNTCVKKIPTHVLLDEGDNPSVNIRRPGIILAEQIRTIDKGRLISKIGKLPNRKMKEVNEAIITSLSIEQRLISRIQQEI